MVWDKLKRKVKNRFNPKKEALLYRIMRQGEWKVYKKFRTAEEKEQYMKSLDENHFIEFK